MTSVPCPPCRPPLPQPHPASCPHTRRSLQLCPKEGQRLPPAPSPHERLHLPVSLWVTPSHSPQPLTCGLMLVPVFSSCTSSFEKPRPKSRRAGLCPGRGRPGEQTRGRTTVGRVARAGHWGWGRGTVGAGPPFDPKELATPTKGSLLLSHFTAGQTKSQTEGGRNRRPSYGGTGTKSEPSV